MKKGIFPIKHSDQMFFIFHLHVGCVSTQRANEKIRQAAEMFREDCIKVYIIPSRNANRLECINPKIIDKNSKLAGEVYSKLKYVNEKIDEFLAIEIEETIDEPMADETVEVTITTWQRYKWKVQRIARRKHVIFLFQTFLIISIICLLLHYNII